jgi:hypothetical protein
MTPWQNQMIFMRRYKKMRGELMNEGNLEKVLTYIGTTYSDRITNDSRYYREINIGKTAEKLGFPDVQGKYGNSNAILLLKNPAPGMKVRIDGRTFVDYAQFNSGVVVPGDVARGTTLPRRAYRARDSMVLVF